jgi:hypothetical protein
MPGHVDATQPINARGAAGGTVDEALGIPEIGSHDSRRKR